MPIAKLSTKGQIVLPRSVRDAHSWRPGDELLIEDGPDGVVIRLHRERRVTRTTIDEVFGCARYRGPRRSLAEMDAGIRKAVRGKR